MATQLSNDTSEPLKYQTWVLRVFIHCEGCKKKVDKILHSIDGVFTVSIDSQQHKVLVVGNIEAEKLIKKLAKAGKRAEILHEDVGDGGSENKTGKSKKKKNKKKNNPDNVEKASGDEGDDQEKNSEEKGDESPPKSSDENDAETEKPIPTNTGGKKKKKKGKKGNKADGANTGDAPASTESPTTAETLDSHIGMMHLGPPYGYLYSFPPPYYPASTYGMSYSAIHPGGTSTYYASPAYGYNQSYARYGPHPSPYPIHAYGNTDHDEDYVNNDGEGGCSIM